MYRREVLRSEVFGDRIAPPTMTLEEFADKEVEDAKERAAREVEAEKYNRFERRL